MKRSLKLLSIMFVVMFSLSILFGCVKEPQTQTAPTAVSNASAEPTTGSVQPTVEPTVSASSTPAQPITITFETSLYTEAAHKVALDKLAEVYHQENPNVTIQMYGVPYASFWDKLTTEMVAGTEACIVQLQLDATMYATYASLREGETGSFVNLDPYIKGTSLETELTGQKLLTYNGHYIGISDYAWGFHSIFYRKSLLKEAGIDPSTIKNWDDLLNAAIKLTKPATADKPAQYGFGILIGPAPLALSEWKLTLAGPAGQGFYFPNEEGPYTADRVSINSAPIAWAAQFWQDLNFKYHVTPIGSQTKNDVRKKFWAGQVAMTIEGPWFTGMTQASDPTVLDDMGVFPIPTVVYEGKNSIYHGNPTAVTDLISSNCKYTDEAWKFLKWMSTPEGQAIVATSGMIPANIQYATSDEYIKNYPLNAEIATFADVYSSPMPDPSIPQLGELTTIALNAAQQMFVTGGNVQDALNAAAQQMKDALNKK